MTTASDKPTAQTSSGAAIFNPKLTRVPKKTMNDSKASTIAPNARCRDLAAIVRFLFRFFFIVFVVVVQLNALENVTSETD